MKVVAQRSKYSKVCVDKKIVNEINSGLVLLVSFTQTDTIDNVLKMVKKIANLRIFDDENGIMNKSILDVGGEILSISQFTLYADTTKGNRPSYFKALNGEEAIKLYEKFNEEMNKLVVTKPGIFGAEMEVSITNDGPITIIMEF
ncbi:d-tyrosyl-tRNA(Tyr) deacylase [Clostridium sp. CAG:609]|jgi:D-tyrosyl-tRNA(Tyr) deacylase|nr:d-tyrosyl-tRNA(Tyr) deacylase [Clostridium sp. CAG:609]